MRLTLRTMLAYMDEILESGDTEAIGKKIDQSEFATNLLHRTRDVVRRLRLGTPDVLDHGLDPNTVAEYLDNALPADRVPDFEKVCLESDVHLAEVASCHQILTLVLGEPVEVDLSSRERMYRLPDLIESEIQTSTDTAERASYDPQDALPAAMRPHDPMVGPHVDSPGVPEWLRAEEEPREPERGRALLVVGLVLASIVATLALLGQFSQGSYLASFLGIDGPDGFLAENSQPDDLPLEDRVNSGGSGGTSTAEFAPAANDVEGSAADGGGDGIDMDDVAALVRQDLEGVTRSSEPSVERSIKPSMPIEGSATTSRNPSGDAKLPPLPTEDAGEMSGAAPSGEMAPSEKPGFPSFPSEAMAADRLGLPPLLEREPPGSQGDMRGPLEPPGDLPPRIAARPIEPKVDGEPGLLGREPAPFVSEGAAPMPAEPLGQLSSANQVLLVSDGNSGPWSRLADQSPITSQTSYLSLPTYRSSVQMTGGTTLFLIGGTQIRLLAPDDAGAPTVKIEFGRLVIESSGTESGALRLVVGDRSGLVGFEEPGATAAVEVGRAGNAATDPETRPAGLVAHLLAVSGTVSWQDDADGQAKGISAPVRLALTERPLEALPVKSLPDWVGPNVVSLLDQQASGTIEKELGVGRQVNLGLRELADHRRREVRRLALWCLDYVGDFEPVVAALDKPDENRLWSDYVDQLRKAICRNPEAAAGVRGMMEEFHGNEGAELYGLLWKYRGQALDRERADELIGYLDHDTLAFRVLAISNLTRITGVSLFYHPEDSMAERRPHINRWRERLREIPSIGGVPSGGEAGSSESLPLSIDGILRESQ